MDVPELTADEIQARVLHRDGLMLVIDKPAGLPVHRGPKGGANLEASFDALRFGLALQGLYVLHIERGPVFFNIIFHQLIIFKPEF